MHDSACVFREIQLKEGQCFLDLGCGSGDYALYAANIVGESGNVYALDRWEQTIDTLTQDVEAQGVKNIKIMHADITGALPIENHCADVCFLATVLHTFHPLQDEKILFHEILRVVKPGGQVAIIECHKERRDFGPPEHMRLSPEELEDILTPYGFEVIETLDLGYNYLIRFQAGKKAES
jgi:ubiquinone/menaquinone biosynthesis C-methylase UbiE